MRHPIPKNFECNVQHRLKYHQQSKNYEKSLKYLNMGFTGMFSVETILKIIGFGVKVGANTTSQTKVMSTV